MHNLCVFSTFSTFAQKGWSCSFTCSFGKVMHIKSLKMVFVARIIRHELCMIYAFLDFFCSKIIFDQKNFPSFWDYPGSIVYLSCLYLNRDDFLRSGPWKGFCRNWLIFAVAVRNIYTMTNKQIYTFVWCIDDNSYRL